MRVVGQHAGTRQELGCFDLDDVCDACPGRDATAAEQQLW